jgi:Fe-S cluster biogenesis protein NfuA
MTSTLDAKDFQTRLQRLDALLGETERAADPASRVRLQEIVQAILSLHATALDRLLEHVADEGVGGKRILDACIGDGVVAGLLLLHGLHPLDAEARVQQALDEVRPYLRSHGGNVEFLELRDGVVRLQLHGSCNHCPSSTVTMQQTVEETIYNKAPEVTDIEVEGMPEQGASLDHDGARIALPIL